MFDIFSSSLEKLFVSFFTERLQYLVYLGVSLVVFSFTIILYFSERRVFQRFLGNIDPLAAFLTAITAGFILLSFLLTKKWFVIFEKGNLIGFLRFGGLAALLGIIMTIVDVRIIFPADINVLIAVMSSTPKNFNFNAIFWISIIIISMAEPIYQTMDMASSNHFPVWAVAFVGLHIFLINFFQLLIFKKYDFIAMYSFRLVYYLFWHIGWGYIRLFWLF